MGILDALLGASSPITAVINKIAPDADARLQYQQAILELQQNGQLQVIADQIASEGQQTSINQAEATNQKLFVAGWRPFIGWICGTAFGWNYVGISIVNTVGKMIGHPVDMIPCDISTMMPVLMGMLGLGGMRTYEKINGVNSGQ